MKKNWRTASIVGIVLLCIGAALVAAAALRGMRAAKGTDLPVQAPPVSEAAQAGTRPLAAAASWSPAARPGTRSAALLPSLDADAALALVEQGFRSVVLPDPFEAFSAQEVAKAADVLDALKDKKAFRTLSLTPVREANLDAFGRALSQLIADSSFDALLVSDASAADAAGKQVTLFTEYLTQLLRGAELSLPVIFDVGTPAKPATPYQEAVSSLADAMPFAEVLVRCGEAGAQSVRAFLNQFGEDTPVSALFDLKTGIPGGTLQETIQFLTALQAFDGIPLILQNAGYTPKNTEAAKLLRKFSTGALDLINATKGLSMSKPVKLLKAEQSVYTDKPTVNFTGASNPLFPLTCNGKDVARNESGDFSMDMPLQGGKNAFKFEHQSKTYVVDVYYTVTVLESVTPKGGIETTGGVEMVVGAVARRGAVVKAALGPQSITLQPGSAGGEDGVNISDSEKDTEFVSYVGIFKLKASGAQKEVLGTLIFTAAYQGLSDKKNGALVTLLPAGVDPPQPPDNTTTATITTTTVAPDGDTAGGTIPDGVAGGDTTTTGSETTTTTIVDTTPAPDTAARPSGALLTPYSNHWLGTAQMVEITESFANARWSGTTDTKYNPTASPLLAGSFDYISGVQTVDGATYYQLGSGKRIKSTDLKVISSGYKLPLNKLRAGSSSSGGALTMRFGVDWKIPFNVDLAGQNYTASEGFNGNVYGVSSFNATGLTITFYHTESYSGSVSAGSSLISDAAWSTDSAKNTVTLKLTFKNAGKFYGWQSYFDGGELVIRLRPKPPASLSGAVVWLDAGHGGADPGAPLVASHATLMQEKFVTILLAGKVKSKLEAAGATVYMTRTTDTYVSPQERVRRTRAQNPDMFISIHTDSHETATPSGTSAFYYRAFSKPLAKAVHDRIVQTYRNSVYVSGNGIPNYVEMRDKADRQARFYPFEVTRIEECPAILVEYGYGSNLTECRVLQNDTYQNLFAQATVDGIKDYLAAQ